MTDVSTRRTSFASAPMSSLIDAPVRYDLAESTGPALRLDELIDVTSLADLTLEYGTTQGDLALREAIAADAGVEPGQVLITVGAIGAMFLVAQQNSHGRLLILTPSFPHAASVPEGLGMPVDRVPLRFEDGYRMDLDGVRAALSPETTLVSVASPQNPSGVRFAEPELRALVELVAEVSPGAAVLVDETYRSSTYGGAPVPVSAAVISPRVVTCSSLSKAHGAAGLRVGWLITTDPEQYERFRNAKFLTSIACSGIDERLATEVLRRSAEVLEPRAALLDKAFGELETWAAGQPVEVVRPDGGALCCLRLPESSFSDAEVSAFYERLPGLDLRVAPGSWFGESDRVMRIGHGHLPPADFTEALSRLAQALNH